VGAEADRVLPGSPFPLGATPEAGGTNFAVASGVADAVTLCLFDSAGTETRLPLPSYDAGVWYGFVPGVGPGQAYGYRVTGPYDAARGLRCNPAKLLLDPYARAISGEVTVGPEVFGYAVDDPDQPSALDSAGHVPRSIVVNGAFDWTDGEPMRRRYSDTIIYELHVKGFTERHPGVPADLRGSYAGLAHEAAVAHLVELGVTAVELLPVHQSVPESFLTAQGLTNYWGYNTIGYFAPHNGYSATVRAGQGERSGQGGQGDGQVAEFKAMVNALHAAGLEVLLDVVFNHTAEADHRGPTLCFRGLDNAAYYRLAAGDPSRYFDTTGTSTATASTSRRLSPGTAAASTRCPRSSTSFRRTRWCPGRSSSPSRGTWARRTAMSSGVSRRCGGSGTGSTATACATSGAATPLGSASSPPGSPARRTCTAARTGASRQRR
jgi:isoamylase